MENKPIYQAVSRAIVDFNQQLPLNKRVAPSPDYKVVGSLHLDSADLVNLLVMIEQQIEEEFGVSVSLFDGKPGMEALETMSVVVSVLERKLSEQGVVVENRVESSINA